MGMVIYTPCSSQMHLQRTPVGVAGVPRTISGLYRHVRPHRVTECPADAEATKVQTFVASMPIRVAGFVPPRLTAPVACVAGIRRGGKDERVKRERIGRRMIAVGEKLKDLFIVKTVQSPFALLLAQI